MIKLLFSVLIFSLAGNSAENFKQFCNASLMEEKIKTVLNILEKASLNGHQYSSVENNKGYASFRFILMVNRSNQIGR